MKTAGPSTGINDAEVVGLQAVRVAMTLMPTPAVVVGADGVIRLVNSPIEQLFGYEPGELVGERIEALVPPEVRGSHVGLRRGFHGTTESRAMGQGRDLSGVSKDGERIPVEIGLKPIQTDEGLVVMATVVDIRERKSHEARFHLALEAAPSAILMADETGRIVLCNASAEETFGFSRSELEGRPVEHLLPPAIRERHVGHREAFSSSHSRRVMGSDRDLLALRSNGTTFPVEVSLQPVSAWDGQRFVIASVVDISNRKAAEARIRESNEALVALNQELTAFAYSTSHDLKAPLATIQGLAGCIHADLAAGDLDEVKQNVVRIEGMAQRLSGLVEDVLAVARADAPRASHRFDVRARITEAVQRHERLQRDNGVTVDLSAVQTVDVTLDDGRFDSIVDNLVSNALHYCDPGKSRREVCISAEVGEGRLTLVVADNGLGIPEGMRERVFGLFQRGLHRRTDSSGIGLALVKKHVDRMGGMIVLKPTPGWTTFEVVLPVSGDP